MNKIIWEKTEYGKASILNVEFGDIKVSTLINSDDADEFVKLLNSASHQMIKLSEENSSLLKNIEADIVLSEMEDVISDTIDNLSKLLSDKTDDNSVQTTLDLTGDLLDNVRHNTKKFRTYSKLNKYGGIPMLKEMKKKGYSQSDLAKMWDLDRPFVYHYIVDHGEKWSDW